MGVRSQHEEVAPPERRARPSFPTPAPGHTPAGTVLAMQRTAGNRAVARMLQRKEVPLAPFITGPADWTTYDRVHNTARWRAACLHNLNAVDSSQYRRIVQRRDFYRWFYEYTIDRGYTTRWPLAASIVANGAHLIADMDEDHAASNEILGLAGISLQGYMREGNQVIFDNVLPKLKRLIDGGPLTGRAALLWDMQTLAEEQTLVAPMYAAMSGGAFDELNYIAREKRWAGLGAWWTGESHVQGEAGRINEGDVPDFDENDMRTIADRWRYGMRLGNTFTPGGTGFNPAADAMPSVSQSYASGAETVAVDCRRQLHYVDAWLNPNPVSRGPVANLVTALGRLNDREKAEMLEDSSPDAWAYSTQLAQWADAGVTEAVVRAALPSDPGHAAAVATFIRRYNTEAAQVRAQYVSIPYGGGF